MTSDHDYIKQHRAVWRRKPILRRIYREQYYSRLLAQCPPDGSTLEIGSGPGFLAGIAPQVWRTDVLPSPYIHCVADVHRLPFAPDQFDTVIGLDVLHHFNRPINALREVARVLKPGGRLALVEPWITTFSRFVYTYLHQEGCDLTLTPWCDTNQFTDDKLAFDGNAAIPYLLLTRGAGHLSQALPELRLVRLEQFSLVTYLLSLGFKPANLLPPPLYPILYRAEEATRPAWSRWAALRALIVWEKSADLAPQLRPLVQS
ncbi:MAG: class I SAM-dependent methyltransferase [Chloroflexia bacterium]